MDISPDVWILHVKEILPYERDGGNFFNTDVTLLFRARFAKKKNVTRLLTKISNGCGGKGIVDFLHLVDDESIDDENGHCQFIQMQAGTQEALILALPDGYVDVETGNTALHLAVEYKSYDAILTLLGYSNWQIYLFKTGRWDRIK